jgi:hypothetical protein
MESKKLGIIKGKNEIFLDKYHRQLIRIRNKLLTYKDCCDRKRLTYILETGAKIAEKHNFKPGYPNWEQVLEQWKKTKYDSYYYLPDKLNKWFIEQEK